MRFSLVPCDIYECLLRPITGLNKSLGNIWWMFKKKMICKLFLVIALSKNSGKTLLTKIFWCYNCSHISFDIKTWYKNLNFFFIMIVPILYLWTWLENLYCKLDWVDFMKFNCKFDWIIWLSELGMITRLSDHGWNNEVTPWYDDSSQIWSACLFSDVNCLVNVQWRN